MSDTVYDSQPSTDCGSIGGPSEKYLVGCEDDLLIPTIRQINDTFLQGYKTWSEYVRSAKELPLSCLPASSLEPTIILQDIPPLPERLRGRRQITGHALWYIPSPELRLSDAPTIPQDVPIDEEGWDPEYVSGVRKTFYLWVEEPTICRLSSRSGFGCQLGRPNGFAILTLCFAYTISAQLLKMQNRRMYYSTTDISHILSRNYKQRPGDVIIHLNHSSAKLVRWLCAILAPGRGWFAKGSVPPWAAYFNEDVRFIISTDIPLKEITQEHPPSSAEAADLIIEFCTLYDFSSQPMAAFSAALLLPFHNRQHLQPELPMPQIPQSAKQCYDPPLYIKDYVNDLRYYMTISVCPLYLGSAIWSIVWQPGVQCNVASAWLGSIHEVLKPLLEAADMEMLAKVFALRCPQLAPLWFGVFVCGCRQVLEMIRCYLMTIEENLSSKSSSFAHPDPNVALWTGSPQSFLDEECSSYCPDRKIQVSRVDLLRFRFNYRLGDPNGIYFGWEPFGTVSIDQIEPELWPRLECSSPSRRYISWEWWVNKALATADYETLTERGYKHDKNIERLKQDNALVISRGNTENIKSVCSQLYSTQIIVEAPTGLLITPSKEATFRILDWGSTLASGDRTIEAMSIPGVRQHPWLADVREIA